MKALLFFTILQIINCISLAQPRNVVACYSAESTPIANTVANVAFRLTDKQEPLRHIRGELLDETNRTVATLQTDEYGQGFIIFIPQSRCYKVRWTIDGMPYMTHFLRIKGEGYAWSIDNTSQAELTQPFPYLPPTHTYTESEQKRLSQMYHRIIRWNPEENDGRPVSSPDSLPDKNILHTDSVGMPFHFRTRHISYLTLADEFQGREKPQKDEIANLSIHPQAVAEDIKVWVMRPHTMQGDSLWVMAYRGDTRLDCQAVDMRHTTRSCLRFLLQDLPRGDVEFRLYDDLHRQIAARNVKVSHYVYTKKYKDMLKADLDCRLHDGVAFPLIPAEEWKECADKGLQICFTPEGGSLLQGVRTQIAFCAINEEGEHIPVSGEIYSPSGIPQTSFESWSDAGGACFLLPSESGKYYATVRHDGKEYRAYLPEVETNSWGISVDCITQIDSWTQSENHIREWKDRLSCWQAFWFDGEKIYSPQEMKMCNENTLQGFNLRMFLARNINELFWQREIFRMHKAHGTDSTRFRGKHLPQNFHWRKDSAGLDLAYDKNLLLEDDIKIRLFNTGYSTPDTIHVILSDDTGATLASQTTTMDAPEIWLRFLLDDSLPCGYANLRVTDAKSGKEYCNRRLFISYYTKHRNYTTARIRDIKCMLSGGQYTTID